jgi:hypothetical protein
VLLLHALLALGPAPGERRLELGLAPRELSFQFGARLLQRLHVGGPQDGELLFLDAVARLELAALLFQPLAALGEAVARQRNSILNQRAVGVASGRDWAAAEIEIDSIRLAQLDSLTQVDMAMGALEDAVQQPSKNFTLLKIVSSSSDRKSKP